MSWKWVSTVSRLRTHATCLPEQLATRAQNAMICLHHGTGCSHSWLKFASSFAEKGYDVVAFDRLGYGGSPAPSICDLPREFLLESVEQVVSVLDSLGLRDPICIVGHSDGASIALMTASLYPKRVACVVSNIAHNVQGFDCADYEGIVLTQMNAIIVFLLDAGGGGSTHANWRKGKPTLAPWFPRLRTNDSDGPTLPKWDAEVPWG